MTLSLPIPNKKVETDYYFLPYHIKQDSMNYSYKLKVGDSDNIRTMRKIM